MEWIDEIIVGLTHSVGSTNIYDILNHLEIVIKVVKSNSVMLHGNLSVYHRFMKFETIYVSDEVVNREFVLAHELGHAILHVDEAVMFYNPLENKGKMERQADYFAAKLLYSDYKIDDGIETIDQLATRLMIRKECVEYLI